MVGLDHGFEFVDLLAALSGGGVGVAPMLPIVQALKAAGNRVITVLAGRTKELIILEKEMREKF